MSRAVLALVVLCMSLACFPAPTSLHVERVLTATALGRFDALDRWITDSTEVTDLDAIVRALPPAPYSDVRYCPIAWGLNYRLTFAHGGGPTLVAVVEADGCRYAYLGPTDRRLTTGSFWARLAGALGYYTRGNDLFPLPTDMRR